jgi:CTP synthase
VELPDAYKSIIESFIHAGAETETKVKLKWVSSEDLDSDEDVKKYLEKMDGILVAPGFGDRGIEGKILAVKYARENKIPFFGICLGMQVAVIEFARNVLKLEGAHSAEMNPTTAFPVIDLMAEQKDITTKGGTMRLGSYPCQLKKKSLASQIYNEKDLIHERHRHRYEFNNTFLEQFEKAGLLPTGINPESHLVEIVEMEQSEHPYFVGVQFHPELKSTALSPHPLFVGFIKAALTKRLEAIVE